MRAALSLVALAASALGANIPRAEDKALYDRHGGGDSHVTYTTAVIVTYTTVCPVTDTVTKPGSTYVTTYTTTSTVKTAVPTTVVVTQTEPPVTKTEGQVIYTTLTELCPVTETKVVEGSTVVVTWTSTSTAVTKVASTATVVTSVAKTETVYTTNIKTEYETTNVYETVRLGPSPPS
jgi:hypothetical protein